MFECLFVFRMSRLQYLIRKKRTSKERSVWYLSHIVKTGISLKEIKTFGLIDHWLKRVDRLSSEMIDEDLTVTKKSVWGQSLLAICEVIISGFVFSRIIIDGLEGKILIGDVITYNRLIFGIKGNVESIFSTVEKMLKDALDVSNFFSMIMDQIIKTPKKRLYNIAAILLSEKCMLAANSTRALQYLAQLEENVITSEDYSGDTGEFDLNWFLLKSHRAEIAHSFVMNFYVYHELAHIKARQDPHAFSVYSSAVSVVSDSLELESPDFAKIFKVPDEELACDVYALDLLFDYVMNAGGDYYYEFMVESYIIAITNLTIMDSISVLTSIEEQYNNSWLRIIVALDALGFYKDKICNIPNFGKTIHRCRKYCYMKYRNYLKEMMCALQMLEAKFGDVLEKYPPFSKEWEEEKRTAISILASIK